MNLSLILNRKENILRRFVWTCFTLFGIFYTGLTISNSLGRFNGTFDFIIFSYHEHITTFYYSEHHASMSTVYKRKSNNTQMVTFPRIVLS